MLEDESIQDIDIANSFESLGEKIADEKLVRKILRSLPKRFNIIFEYVLFIFDFVLFNIISFLELFYFN